MRRRRATMSVNYAAGLSPYADKGKCGLPEVRAAVSGSPNDPDPSLGAAGRSGALWEQHEAQSLDNERDFPGGRGRELTPLFGQGDTEGPGSGKE